MTLEPTVAVTTLERALRQLLAHELRVARGPDWLKQVTTPELRAKWQGRFEQEKSRRPGVLVVPSVGLEYSELYELIAIARDNWEQVAPALGKKAAMLPLLEHFERVRNRASHSRELMSGVAGEIQNKVTIHMSSQDPAGDYYPRIESAHDSVGSAITLFDPVIEIAGSVPHSAGRTVLQVGDVVTFTCTGTDPKGRDLEWILYLPESGHASATVVTKSGEPVELQWLVTEDQVSESTTAHIEMSAAGARFHRARGFDHRTYFTYIVRPPEV